MSIPPGQIFTQVLTLEMVCVVFGPVSSATDYVINLSPAHGSNTFGTLNPNAGYNHCFNGLQPGTVYTITITPQSAGQNANQQFQTQVRTGKLSSAYYTAYYRHDESTFLADFNVFCCSSVAISCIFSRIRAVLP